MLREQGVAGGAIHPEPAGPDRLEEDIASTLGDFA